MSSAKDKTARPKYLKDPLGYYWMVLVLIILTALFLVFRLRIFQNPSSIKIESLAGELNVEVGKAAVGKTPYLAEDLKTGETELTLSKTSPFYAPLERKIKSVGGKQGVVRWELGPAEVFSSGEIITFDSGQEGLSVISSPDGATVKLNGEEGGKTPLLINLTGLSANEIILEKEGYLSRIINLETPKKLLTQVSVQLFAVPLPKEPGKIREEGLSGFPKTDMITRYDWNADDSLSDQDKNTYHPVKKLVFYDLSMAEAPFGVGAKDWVQGIYYYSTVYAGYSDLPYHYLIDSQGTVYEGKKGGCEAFPANDSQDSLDAECRVGYLGKKGQEITQEAFESFGKLVALTAPSLYLAEAPSVEPIEIDSQTQKTIPLEFKNSGEAIWYQGGEKAVYLRPENPDSRFYPGDKWKAKDLVGELDNPWVLPGWGTTFSLTLNAQTSPGDYEEKFSLYRSEGENRIKIEGSETTIKIKIVGEAVTMVKIKETGTGFLNVRNGPGYGSGIIDTVAPGQIFPLVEEQSGWAKIRYSVGKEGWVSQTYVEKQ